MRVATNTAAEVAEPAKKVAAKKKAPTATDERTKPGITLEQLLSASSALRLGQM